MKRKRKVTGVTFSVLVIFQLLLTTTELSSQNPIKVDSLLNLINTAEHDSIRINNFIRLSDYFKPNNPDTAMYYSLESLELAEETGSKFHMAKSHISIGSVAFYKGDYNTAIDHYNKSLTLSLEIDNKTITSNNYSNIGVIYGVQGNYNRSLEYFLKALEIDEEAGDDKGLAIRYNNIGLLYKIMEDFDKAIEYYNKSIKKHKEINDTKGLSACYSNLGMIHLDNNEFDKAMESLKTGLGFIEEEDKNGRAILLAALGETNMMLERFSLATDYFFQALKINKELGRKHGIGSNYGLIAELYLKMGKYEDALNYAQMQLEIATTTNALPQQSFAYESLSMANEKLGNYQDAFENMKLFKQVTDSIFSKESADQFAEMQTKYETVQKEKENELLRKDNEINSLAIDKETNLRNFFMVLTFLGIVLGIFIYSRFRIKKRVNKQLTFKNKQISDQKEQLFETLEQLKAANEELESHKNNLEELVRERVKELELKNEELEKYNKLFIGREFRIKELKDTVIELKTQLKNLGKS